MANQRIVINYRGYAPEVVEPTAEGLLSTEFLYLGNAANGYHLKRSGKYVESIEIDSYQPGAAGPATLMFFTPTANLPRIHLDVIDVTYNPNGSHGQTVGVGAVEKVPGQAGEGTSDQTLFFWPPSRDGDVTEWSFSHKTPTLGLKVSVKRVNP